MRVPGQEWPAHTTVLRHYNQRQREWRPVSCGLPDREEIKHGNRERRGRDHIRAALSPRHVPDAVLAIDAVPRTLNGKKSEVSVMKVLLGWPLARAVNLGSVANPHALQCFMALAQHVEADTIG